MTTITLLAVELSRAPRSSNHVTAMTIAHAGRFTSTGWPARRGAVSSRPCTAGSALRSAVRYPVVSQPGGSMPIPLTSVVK